MTAKEYMTQAHIHSQHIDERLNDLRKLCGRGKKGDPAIRELYRGMKEEFSSLQRQQKEMAAMITRLPDENHRNVLVLRYLCGMRWEQIARKMHYSSRHLHRLHHQALKELEKTGGAGFPLLLTEGEKYGEYGDLD